MTPYIRSSAQRPCTRVCELSLIPNAVRNPTACATDVSLQPLAPHAKLLLQVDAERRADAVGHRQQVRQRRAKRATDGAARRGARVAHLSHADRTQHALALGARVRRLVADLEV